MKLIRILVLLTVLLTGLGLPASAAPTDFGGPALDLPDTPDDPGFGV